MEGWCIKKKKKTQTVLNAIKTINRYCEKNNKGYQIWMGGWTRPFWGGDMLKIYQKEKESVMQYRKYTWSINTLR